MSHLIQLDRATAPGNTPGSRRPLKNYIVSIDGFFSGVLRLLSDKSDSAKMPTVFIVNTDVATDVGYHWFAVLVQAIAAST